MLVKNKLPKLPTIQIDIADNKLDTFLTIVENLQKDIVIFQKPIKLT